MSPGLLMAALFYSVAFHMHHELGNWPAKIGDKGFSPALIVHGQIAFDYFGVMILISLFVWPLTLLTCDLIQRWRKAVPYLGIYFLTVLIAFGSMLLAPASFLNWWWD